MVRGLMHAGVRQLIS